jgi:hypothetical protein
VVNPFALELSFSDARTRMRRDHGKFLALIRTVALLHQHQRTVHTAVDPREATIAANNANNTADNNNNGTAAAAAGAKLLEYVEVTREDIAMAERLFSSALARSLDELPPQTRGVLQALEMRVLERASAQQVRREEVRFTQREARAWTGLSASHVRRHLQRLELLELVFVVRGKKTWEYVLGEQEPPADQSAGTPSDGTGPTVRESHHRTTTAPWSKWRDVSQHSCGVMPIAPSEAEITSPVVPNGASYVGVPHVGVGSFAATGE